MADRLFVSSSVFGCLISQRFHSLLFMSDNNVRKSAILDEDAASPAPQVIELVGGSKDSLDALDVDGAKNNNKNVWATGWDDAKKIDDDDEPSSQEKEEKEEKEPLIPEYVLSTGIHENLEYLVTLVKEGAYPQKEGFKLWKPSSLREKLFASSDQKKKKLEDPAKLLPEEWVEDLPLNFYTKTVLCKRIVVKQDKTYDFSSDETTMYAQIRPIDTFLLKFPRYAEMAVTYANRVIHESNVMLMSFLIKCSDSESGTYFCVNPFERYAYAMEERSMSMHQFPNTKGISGLCTELGKITKNMELFLNFYRVIHNADEVEDGAQSELLIAKFEKQLAILSMQDSATLAKVSTQLVALDKVCDDMKGSLESKEFRTQSEFAILQNLKTISEKYGYIDNDFIPSGFGTSCVIKVYELIRDLHMIRAKYYQYRLYPTILDVGRTVKQMCNQFPRNGPVYFYQHRVSFENVLNSGLEFVKNYATPIFLAYFATTDITNFVGGSN